MTNSTRQSGPWAFYFPRVPCEVGCGYLDRTFGSCCAGFTNDCSGSRPRVACQLMSFSYQDRDPVLPGLSLICKTYSRPVRASPSIQEQTLGPRDRLAISRAPVFGPSGQHKVRPRRPSAATSCGDGVGAVTESI